MAPRHRLTLAVCAVASLLAHGMIWWTAADLPQTPHRRAGGVGPAGTLRFATVRQVSVGPAQAAADPQPRPRPLPLPLDTPTVKSPAASSPRNQARADDTAGSGADTATTTDTSNDDVYLPGHALTRTPAPVAPIDLPYPDTAPQGSFHAVLTLFIDETGQVRRVRVESVGEEGLPPELEEAARQTFLSSRFSPGERHEQPVKSQIRIAVEFIAEPAAAPAPGEPP